MAIVILVYWLLNQKSEVPVSSWLNSHIEQIRNYYKVFPVLSIVLFCLAHFTSALFCLPGSCTFLNILSGAIFGFRRGVCIVYLITILSGATGYFLGMKLPLQFLKNKYQNQIENLKRNLLSNGHSYLILSRLSPLLPYGMLNMLFGFLKVPFFIFILTTIVGIFFDVVLLNSIGAFLSSNAAASIEDKRNIAIAFFILFISSIFVNLLRSKWIAVSSNGERAKE